MPVEVVATQPVIVQTAPAPLAPPVPQPIVPSPKSGIFDFIMTVIKFIMAMITGAKK